MSERGIGFERYLRRIRCLAAAALLLGTGGAALAAEAGAEAFLKAAEAPAKADGPAAAPNRLTPEEEAGLIDKGRIAEETYQRFVGLREAGNPHIRDGLEIGRIEEEPGKVQVDMDRLREEAIRQIEERPDFSRPIPDDLAQDGDMLHHEHPDGKPCGPECGDPAPRLDPNTVTIVLIGAIGALLIAGVLIYMRNREG